MLEVRLLGQFDVRVDSRPVEIPSRPAQSLLAYLVVHAGARHRREQLAGVFWPDSAEANARNNLRVALWRINRALGATHLQTDRLSVAFDAHAALWLDVAVLARDAGQMYALDDLRDAVAVYAGELLPGFYDDWVAPERERLRAVFERKMGLLLDRLLAERRWQEAIDWAERSIGLGEVPEPAYRALMVAYSHRDGRASVAAIYRRCVEALQREFGVEPSNETQATYQHLARGEQPTTLPDDVLPGNGLAQPRRWTLPLPATPFVGRTAELAEIAALLDDPSCRLLTLVGPGGIGKTRLALAAAARSDTYTHGACFVDLAPLTSADLLVSAIAETLKLSCDGDARALLLDYLREKIVLLLLDNCEHVLEGATLISDILASAPGVRVLATSRERLRLRAERAYEVGGLAWPELATEPDIEAYDAVQLFVAYARHAQPRYQLAEMARPAVGRICRLVSGMPLGIELAAAWARTLPAEAIAAEIEANLDFLRTTLRDVPERHRSMRAAFAHTWNLLSPVEQAAFKRLAVFRGGFTREAAHEVAGAVVGTLAALFDKSLLQVDADGRYTLHELLRQFAEEKLAADAETDTATRDRHSDFFLQFVQRREQDLNDHRQPRAIREIEPELDNVREAWHWAIQRRRWQPIRQARHALTHALDMRSRFHDGVTLFTCLAAALVEATATAAEVGALERGLLGAALMSQGWFLLRSGRDGAGSSCLEQSRALLEANGEPYDIALHRFASGGRSASLEQGRVLLEQSLAIFRDIGHAFGAALALDARGRLELAHGRHAEAKQFAEAALAARRVIGAPDGISAALHALGRIEFALGHNEVARRLQQESLAIRRESGIRVGAAHCLDSLGEIAFARGELHAAQAYYRASLDLYRDLGHRSEQASSLCSLGEIALAQDNVAEAAQLLDEALTLFEQSGSAPGLARAHNLLGHLSLRQETPA